MMDYRFTRTRTAHLGSPMASKQGSHLLVCVFTTAYFVSLFLSPWLHSHSGQNHGALEGDVLHPHVLLSTSLSAGKGDFSSPTVSARTSNDNVLDAKTLMHLWGSGAPLLTQHRAFRIYHRSPSRIPLFTLKVGTRGSPGTAPSRFPPATRVLQEVLPNLSSKEFVVLVGTDLPPPIA